MRQKVKTFLLFTMMTCLGMAPLQEIPKIQPSEIGPDPDFSQEAREQLEQFWGIANQVKSKMESGNYTESDFTDDELDKYYAAYDSPNGYPETIYQIENPNVDWDYEFELYASSELNATSGYTYDVQNSYDADLSTAWVEGVKGDGVGESIVYKLKYASGILDQIMIYNGYTKSEPVWQSNSRVKQLTVIVNEQPRLILELEDVMGPQWFDIGWNLSEFESPLELTFRIDEVYKGTKYQDTAITELILVGFP